MNTPMQVEILLVEDDEDHAELIQLNLIKAGIDNLVTHLADGQAAIDYIQELVDQKSKKSLLMLLDLNLPVLDGFNVLQKMKAKPETNSIPIVILTSTNTPEEIDRCYRLGCNVFINKPVDYPSFVNAIKQLGLFLSVIELPPNLN